MPLFFALTFPSFFLVVFEASSFATGMFILATLYAAFILYYRIRATFSQRYLIVGLLLATWGFAASINEFGEIDERQVYSFLVFIFICGNAAIYIAELLRKPYAYLKRSIYLTYGLLLIFGIAGVLNLLAPGPYANLSRPVFPFAEPSHFALAFCFISCLMICIVQGPLRYAVVLPATAFAVLFPNATLLVGAILLAITYLRTLRNLFFIIPISTVIFVIVQLSPETAEYFDSRLFDRDGENISRLVYQQGWESVVLSLKSTNFFGLGFQNLGKQGTGEFTFALDGFTSGSLNRLDGGFLFSKIASEFGVAGVACCAFLCYNAFRSVSTIIRYNTIKEIGENSFSRNIFPACCSYMLIVELFVRGVGYFSPTFIFALCCSGLLVSIGGQRLRSRQP